MTVLAFVQDHTKQTLNNQDKTVSNVDNLKRENDFK